MKIIKFVLITVGLFLLIWTLWPSDFDAVAWTPGVIPELKGPYEMNDRLDAMSKKYTGLCDKCEDVAIDTAGAIYTGEEGGDILIFKNGKRTVLANTGGRPLGMDLAPDNLLIVADAYKGLLSVDKNGKVDVLSTGYSSVSFKLTDDIEIGSDGIYYFTDASSKYDVTQSTRDLVEHGGHGRLLAYDPATEKTTLLMDGLHFANGVAVAPDASFVLVNETGSYCVWKYWLKGPDKGKSEKLIANLPGFPDNISSGTGGIYWLTLVAPRDPQIEKIMPNAWIRNLIMKLPASWTEPKPKHFGMILGIKEDGTIVYNFQDATPNLLMITSVEEHDGHLIMGTLTDNGIGVMAFK